MNGLKRKDIRSELQTVAGEATLKVPKLRGGEASTITERYRLWKRGQGSLDELSAAPG